MSRYSCVIFDCDGVLVDTEPIANRVLVDMANALGADIDMEYAYEFFKGNALQHCLQLIRERIDGPLPKHFEQQFRQESFEAFKREVRPVKGIKTVLDVLSVPFCVASSGPQNKIELNLELTGLTPYFSGRIFSCYTIQRWKPDPEVFLWAARTMGFDPSQCLIVEDSKLGVTAGLNGGFDVAALMSERDIMKHQLKPTHRISSPIQILDLF